MASRQECFRVLVMIVVHVLINNNRTRDEYAIVLSKKMFESLGEALVDSV